MGRCKSLGSLKSFLWYALELSGASILCFHILSFLGALCREWLQSVGCWMAGILFSPEFPPGSLALVAGLQSLVTVASFVYWYGRKYSIYHDTSYLDFPPLPSIVVISLLFSSLHPLPCILGELFTLSFPLTGYILCSVNSARTACSVDVSTSVSRSTGSASLPSCSGIFRRHTTAPDWKPPGGLKDKKKIPLFIVW